jgi:hypothetical protein
MCNPAVREPPLAKSTGDRSTSVDTGSAGRPAFEECVQQFGRHDDREVVVT